MARTDGLTARLRSGPPLVLDGAMGTELERRGVALPPPLWSARALVEAPATVLEVHRAYARAGADLLVTNTFRTLDRAGPGGAGLVADAVGLARRAAAEEHAASGREIFVLGSIGPLEDCYSPDLVPAEPALSSEHAGRATALAAAGVDALLVETMNTVREALAAVAAARATGLVTLAGFVADRDGRLFDGTPLAEAVPALVTAGAAAVLVNCTPIAAMARVVPELARLVGEAPFGVYANNGYPHPGVESGEAVALDPERYAAAAAAWLTAGARLIGGCCGTTPAHIAALRRLVDSTAAV